MDVSSAGLAAAEAAARAGVPTARLVPSPAARWTDGNLLVAACCQGDTARLGELLAAGLSPNARGHLPHSEVRTLPLVAATRFGHAGAVSMLLDRGARPNACVPGSRETALIVAIRTCQPQLVRLLAPRSNLLAHDSRLGRPVDVAARERHTYGAQSNEVYRFVQRATMAQGLDPIAEEEAPSSSPSAPTPPPSPMPERYSRAL